MRNFLIIFGVGLMTLSVFFKPSSASFTDTERTTGNVLSVATTFGTSSAPPSATPAAEIDHLVISEVQIDGGTGSANDNDFIEIYNPTSDAISLNGYHLVKRTGSSANDSNVYTFNSTQSVLAHGFFLWANNGYGNSVNADASSSATLASSNSIALRNGSLDSGQIIDALSWNSAQFSLKEGVEFSPNPGVNQSMERKAYSTSTASTMIGSDSDKGNSFDSDNNSTDFLLRTTSQPQNSSSPTEMP